VAAGERPCADLWRVLAGDSRGDLLQARAGDQRMQAMADLIDPDIGARQCAADAADGGRSGAQRENIFGKDDQPRHEAHRVRPGGRIARGAGGIAQGDCDLPGCGDALGDEAGVETRLIRAEVFQKRAGARQLPLKRPIGRGEGEFGGRGIGSDAVQCRHALRQPAGLAPAGQCREAMHVPGDLRADGGEIAEIRQRGQHGAGLEFRKYRERLRKLLDGIGKGQRVTRLRWPKPGTLRSKG
jgi:hypothetical protein